MYVPILMRFNRNNCHSGSVPQNSNSEEEAVCGEPPPYQWKTKGMKILLICGMVGRRCKMSEELEKRNMARLKICSGNNK